MSREGYNDYDDYEGDDRGRRGSGEWPHSGVGIASFIAGILALFMVLVGFLVAVIAAAAPPQRSGGPPPAAVFGGFLLVGAGLVALIGTGLGIGSVCQSRRKKVFGIIGLCVNALILLGGLAIVLLGIAMMSTLH